MATKISSPPNHCSAVNILPKSTREAIIEVRGSSRLSKAAFDGPVTESPKRKKGMATVALVIVKMANQNHPIGPKFR